MLTLIVIQGCVTIAFFWKVVGKLYEATPTTKQEQGWFVIHKMTCQLGKHKIWVDASNYVIEDVLTWI